MLLTLLVIVVDEASVLEEDEDPTRAALLFVFRHAAGAARDFGKFDPVKVDDAGKIQEGPTCHRGLKEFTQIRCRLASDSCTADCSARFRDDSRGFAAKFFRLALEPFE
jgi:hypothetical protein